MVHVVIQTAYAYGHLLCEKELYVFEDSLKWMKQTVDDRLKVVFPPSIASILRRGQYLYLFLTIYKND